MEQQAGRLEKQSAFPSLFTEAAKGENAKTSAFMDFY